jgi:hypothetical protein
MQSPFLPGSVSPLQKCAETSASVLGGTGFSCSVCQSHLLMTLSLDACLKAHILELVIFGARVIRVSKQHPDGLVPASLPQPGSSCSASHTPRPFSPYFFFFFCLTTRTLQVHGEALPHHQGTESFSQAPGEVSPDTRSCVITFVPLSLAPHPRPRTQGQQWLLPGVPTQASGRWPGSNECKGGLVETRALGGRGSLGGSLGQKRPVAAAFCLDPGSDRGRWEAAQPVAKSGARAVRLLPAPRASRPSLSGRVAAPPPPAWPLSPPPRPLRGQQQVPRSRKLARRRRRRRRSAPGASRTRCARRAIPGPGVRPHGESDPVARRPAAPATLRAGPRSEPRPPSPAARPPPCAHGRPGAAARPRRRGRPRPRARGQPPGRVRLLHPLRL